MTAKRPAAVLLWSLPEEPYFIEYLKQKYGEFVLCPLKLPALRSARELVPAGQILDVGSVVPAEERHRAYDQSVEDLNRVYRDLLECDEPWLNGIDFIKLFTILYSFEYWRTFLGRLESQHGVGEVCSYGPFSRGAILDGGSLIDADLLHRLVVAREQGGVRYPRRPMIEWLGGWVNRCVGAATVRATRSEPSLKPASCVVMGLQATDCRVQKGMVQELLRRGFDRFRWMVPLHRHFAVAADEEVPSALQDRVDLLTDTCDTDPAQGMVSLSWRNAVLESLSHAQILGRIGRAVFGAAKGRLSPVEARLHAHFLLANSSNLRLEYDAVERMMKGYRPDVVVTNSNIQIPLMVRAWTRKNRVPHLQLPHGVVYCAKFAPFWDADELAVPGEDVRGKLARLYPDKQPFLRIVGGAHLAAQAQRAGVRGAGVAGAKKPWKACFLLSEPIAYSLPDAFTETERDFIGLARAIEAQGGRLSLRGHRGSPDQTMYRLIARRAKAEGVTIEFSDPLSSLQNDLADSSLALIRVWGGAGILALFAGVPLMGWSPRPDPDESAEILRDLPLCAETIDAVAPQLERLLESESFRRDVLSRQRAFLERHVSHPEAAPFEPLAEAVIRFHEQHATQSR